MKLIINADDFAYTKGVTQGIMEGYHHGIIRSTTVLSNMPYLAYGASLVKDADELGIGVHLTLTLGDALTHGKTITTNGTHFKSRKQFYEELDHVDLQEVYDEFEAQIEHFIKVMKRCPDHLDSHHSVHDAKGLLEVSIKLAKRYHIPMRRYANAIYVPGFYGETATVDDLIALILQHKDEEAIEIMTHPGFCDLELYENSSYHTQRVVELSVLCDERIKEVLHKEHIDLTNYKMLKSPLVL